MLHRPVSGLAGIIVLFCCAGLARAQEFRVYTQLFDLRHAPVGQKSAHPRPVGRSTSLFHAGKVYERIDTGNQMTICEPAHQRFLIIDASSRQSAELSFEEINRYVYRAEMRAGEYLREPGTGAAAAALELLKFEIAPKFKESYDEAERRLTLSSSVLTYEVKCATHESPEVIDAYLQYADWLARLNYVLHEQTLFPGPRLALNEALRRRRLLPVEVTLRSASRTGMQLRAEHRFDWRLDDTDRKVIGEWEARTQNRSFKHVEAKQFLATVKAARPDDRKQVRR